MKLTCINMKKKLCESEMNTSSVPFISNPGLGLGYLNGVALARMDSLFVSFLFLNVAAIMDLSILVFSR